MIIGLKALTNVGQGFSLAEVISNTKGLCPFESPSSDFKNGENEGFPFIPKGLPYKCSKCQGKILAHPVIFAHSLIVSILGGPTVGTIRLWRVTTALN